MTRGIFFKKSYRNPMKQCVCMAGPASSSLSRIVLNVAEKPSVAKEIAHILSKGNMRSQPGISKYNYVHEFCMEIDGMTHQMRFTSVSGHLMSLDFAPEYKSWTSVDASSLFQAKVHKFVPKNNVNIQKTLHREARKCGKLILWLDCDREGENIAMEVVNVCREKNATLEIQRARFSAIIPRDIWACMQHLDTVNTHFSDAVDARQEIDLRIGAAFTRFQTLFLQKQFGNLASKIVSYGPCQFPTLGFVVERAMEIERFVPEAYWVIHASHNYQNQQITWKWQRERLFDEKICRMYENLCRQNSQMTTVTEIQTQPKRKWRPLPLSTVELQKLSSRKLHLSSEKTLAVAEALYQRGILSYPRTETDQFSKNMPLRDLIQSHTRDSQWGDFASKLLSEQGFQWPRQGKHDDKAHPPIHPTKYVNNLTGDEKRIYELVVRHFLACCSQDAQGAETLVTATLGGETFTTKGLVIHARNYLDVYIYDKWSTYELPNYTKGMQFEMSELACRESSTQPPSYLSESDLIVKMDNHGIGTDATIAQHIKTIQDRDYALKDENQRFKPTSLGYALVLAYEAMGFDLHKPRLRAQMEADLVQIANGAKSRSHVVTECIHIMQQVFQAVNAKSNVFAQTIGSHLASNTTTTDSIPTSASAPPSATTATVLKTNLSECGQCGCRMDLIQEGSARKMTCKQCNQSHLLPHRGEITVNAHRCPLCQFQALNIATSSTSSHTICPYCFSHPPEEAIELDPSNRTGGFRCFKCVEVTCPLATSATAQFPLFSCHASGCQGHMVLKTKRNKQGFFIGCNQYPKCNAVTWLDGAIQSIIPSKTKFCSQCSRSRLVTAQVQGQSHEGCLNGCNSSFMNLLGIHSQPTPAQPVAPLQPPSQYPSTPRYSENTAPLPSTNGERLCDHKEPVIKLTVNKEGPNKGRTFYKCSRPASDQCRYFEWAEDSSSIPHPMPQTRTFTCYKCGEVGHFANQCTKS